jgi:phosphoribosyl-ATP pyrophosphohydrolase/phosphoribosyl-AMP cyclohydrolase
MSNKLIPAIIQDVETSKVLMLGYMNDESIEQTIQTGNVTFYSRSKDRLWMKGEESGNVLRVVSMDLDCDRDTYLIKVYPAGPVCHQGTDTCWGEENKASYGFLSLLEQTIDERIQNPSQDSYVSGLYQEGIQRIAQKVGEEAVETVLEMNDASGERLLSESADLIFHLLLLLKAKGFGLEDVVNMLQHRAE